MSRNTHTFSLRNSVLHNFTAITPKVAGVTLLSISTHDRHGKEVLLLPHTIEINKATSVRYGLIESRTVTVSYSHDLADAVRVEDLLTVEAGLSKYDTQGGYISNEQSMPFSKNVNLLYDIDNILDVYNRCRLNLRVVDKYGVILYGATVPISVNNDGMMIEPLDDDGSAELPYAPEIDSIYLLVGDSVVNNYLIDGKTVSADIPAGYTAYVVYRPDFSNGGVLFCTDGKIEVMPDYSIQLDDRFCDSIFFSIEILSINTETTSFNHTPIIKSLGIMASDI